MPTLASNSYVWVVVTQDFQKNVPWNLIATNMTLQERSSEEVFGLVNDRGSPVMQISASINPWPTSGEGQGQRQAGEDGTLLW